MVKKKALSKIKRRFIFCGLIDVEFYPGLSELPKMWSDRYLDKVMVAAVIVGVPPNKRQIKHQLANRSWKELDVFIKGMFLPKADEVVNGFDGCIDEKKMCDKLGIKLRENEAILMKLIARRK